MLFCSLLVTAYEPAVVVLSPGCRRVPVHRWSTKLREHREKEKKPHGGTEVRRRCPTIGMVKIARMGDLFVRSTGRQKCRIMDHPLTRALQQRDRAAFDRFAAAVSQHQKKKPSATWKGLLALVESIRDEGLRVSRADPIVFKRVPGNPWCCSHGRHRMCVVAYLYGSEARVYISLGDKKKPPKGQRTKEARVVRKVRPHKAAPVRAISRAQERDEAAASGRSVRSHTVSAGGSRRAPGTTRPATREQAEEPPSTISRYARPKVPDDGSIRGSSAPSRRRAPAAGRGAAAQPTVIGATKSVRLHTAAGRKEPR